MDILDAIYHRRSVRKFLETKVPSELVMDLLKAAVQAPSAENLQPWGFAVYRGRRRLADYSRRAKIHLLSVLHQSLTLHLRADDLADEHYNVFHDAGTLIVICARPAPHHPAEDCCLAGENLMLAAHGMGLGTCPVGYVRPWLDLPEIKEELGLPRSYHVVLPIVVGWPQDRPPPVPRLEPEVLSWQETNDTAHLSSP